MTMDVKNLTIKQAVAANKAISRVRDQNLMTGGSIPGCTFSTMIMFRNAWTQNQLEATIKGYTEALEAIRKKHQKFAPEDKDKKVPLELKPKEQKAMSDELDKLLNSPAEGLVLKKYSLKELVEMDEDDYLKKVNEKHPVPQEFISLLMEAGLIDDDT